MKKIIPVLCAAVMALSLFAGCGQKANDNGTTAAGGTVATDGSTSMEKVIGALGESFMEANKGTTFTYNPTGSGSGIQAVSEGRCDIGLSSRALKDDEKAAGLKETIVALDGIAIIVNPQNPVKDLSLEQIAKIYTGEITNWKDVGGKDQEIVAFQRGEDSGSQTLFKKLLIQGGELMTPPSELAPAAMGELVDSIADYNNSANAIGFSVYYYIDQMYSKPGLRLLAVDGVTPSNDTLADGSYPLCNDFYAVIHPDAAADSPERRLYDWLDTDAGQDCIKKSGYVAVGPQTTVTIVD